MNILEKAIEDLLFHGIENDEAVVEKKGMPLLKGGRYYRQLDIGPYGRADILGIRIGNKVDGKRIIDIHVIELKKEKIDFGSLNQALSYARGIQCKLEKKLLGCVFVTHIALVGKSIDMDGSFCYLPNICPNVALYTYKLDFYEGLLFENGSDFQLTYATFPPCSIISDRLDEMAFKRYVSKRKPLTELTKEEIDDLPY